jgi:4-amino-4-deoxy-L-arabinose transferase-like glycosyltransferase
MSKKKWSGLVILVCLLVLIIPSRVIGIDKFVTYDEPWWVISGSNYYYALTHRDFANTIYDYHPAVMTTWMVTGGMLSYFPEYRGFGQGYFDVRKSQFETFMRDHGKETIILVRNSRLIQASLLIILALLGFYLLQLLVDRRAAFLAIVLAMNAPYYLGFSRLLTHEGMLSMFVLVSLLGMQVYIGKGQKLRYLFISGAAFGLAQLTKSSSLVVAPLVGLMLLVNFFKQDGTAISARFWSAAKSFVIWFGVAAFVFVVLWPGMWVAPGKMLYEIYGNAFSYAFQGARLEVTQELQPSNFNLGNGISGSLSFLNSWVVASTSISWIGLVLALFLLFSKNRELPSSPVRSTMIYLGILAGLFILMFGVAQGRNAPYYILSSFVSLDVISGMGWGYLLVWLQRRWFVFRRVYVQAALMLLVIGLQLASGISYYPYYITYKNPMVAGPSAYGYGVGMDQAAAYLAQKPDAGQKVAYAYLGIGSFSYFYPGETRIFKKVYLANREYDSVIKDMHDSDYLVVYSAIQNREPESEMFLHLIEDIQPEKIILINDEEYARIYRIVDFPESFYEALLRQ